MGSHSQHWMSFAKEKLRVSRKLLRLRSREVEAEMVWGGFLGKSIELFHLCFFQVDAGFETVSRPSKFFFSATKSRQRMQYL